MSYGFAVVNRGWAVDGPRIRRAASVVDKVRRLLRPLWGAVWAEKVRGDAEGPVKNIDAIAAIVTDRIHHLLAPMVRSGEIAKLDVEANGASDDSARVMAAVKFVDAEKRPFELTVFVRV